MPTLGAQWERMQWEGIVASRSGTSSLLGFTFDGITEWRKSLHPRECGAYIANVQKVSPQTANSICP